MSQIRVLPTDYFLFLKKDNLENIANKSSYLVYIIHALSAAKLKMVDMYVGRNVTGRQTRLFMLLISNALYNGLSLVDNYKLESNDF